MDSIFALLYYFIYLFMCLYLLACYVGSDFPGLAHGQRKMKGIRNGSKDGCRKKLEYTNSKKDSNKPPLSYASLIALAICSTPQRMMTLSSIYRWIEYTFPFYRTPEAKAWKASVNRKNQYSQE